MIATAESCTAENSSGSLPFGSSIISRRRHVYSNEAKNKYCGVSMDLIQLPPRDYCKQVAIDLAGYPRASALLPGYGNHRNRRSWWWICRKARRHCSHRYLHGYGQSHHAHCTFNGTRDQVTDQACGKVVFMLLRAYPRSSLKLSIFKVFRSAQYRFGQDNKVVI